MGDLTITSSGELMIVTGVTGETDEGVEFVDSWVPTRKGADYHVVDSGRLVIETSDVDDFVKAAELAGLDVDMVTGL